MVTICCEVMDFEVRDNSAYPTPEQRELVGAFAVPVREALTAARLQRLGEAALERVRFEEELSPELRATVAAFLVRTQVKLGHAALDAGQHFLALHLSSQLAAVRVLMEVAVSLRWLAEAKSVAQVENRILRLLLREFGHRDHRELAQPTLGAARRVAQRRRLLPAPTIFQMAEDMDRLWEDVEHPWQGGVYSAYQLASYHLHYTLAGPGSHQLAGTTLVFELGSREEVAQGLQALALAVQLYLSATEHLHGTLGADPALGAHRTRLTMLVRRELELMGLQLTPS